MERTPEEKKKIVEVAINHIVDMVGIALNQKLKNQKKKTKNIKFITSQEPEPIPEETKKELDDLVKLALAKHGLLKKEKPARKPEKISDRMKNSLNILNNKK